MIETGDLINDRYELIEKIGRGGFGEVWKAHDLGLENTVALKFLTKSSPEAENAFLREARLIRKLAGSPHPGHSQILDIRSYSRRNGETPPFLELEYLRHGSLAAFIEQNHQMRADQFKKLLRDLVLTIQCAHACDVLHCDIKPQNILLSGEDGYKLSDFGLARKMGEVNSRSWGTPAYMSPEQFDSQANVSWASDVYSMGAVLYECAEGRKVFDGKSREEYARKHRESELAQFTNHAIGDDLKQIIMDCLRKNPDNRPGLDSILSRLNDIDSDIVDPVKRIPELRHLSEAQVEHPDSKLTFVDTHIGVFVPDSLISNLHFEKFLNSDDGRKYRPGILDPKMHDGGYLSDWAFGKPLSNNLEQHASGIPYDIAAAFCRWVGGRLPTLAEMKELAEKDAKAAVLAELRSVAKGSEWPYMNCWCSSPEDEFAEERKAMWIFWAADNPYGDAIQSVARRRFFCFPHYFLFPVIDGDVARSAPHSSRRTNTEHALYSTTASRSANTNEL